MQAGHGDELKMYWEPRLEPPPLEGNEVHVWRIALQPEIGLADSLSDEERMHADRFFFSKDREAFKSSRNTLRILIGHYQDCRPETVEFYSGKYEKPALIGEGLQFNISHSHRVGLLAFSRGRDVGVDVEKIDPAVNSDQLALHSFSYSENQEYQGLRPEEKLSAFYRGWTRKEAFIKATGEGLSYPLDRFDVSLSEGDSARLLRIEGSEENARHWGMRDLALTPEYAAAVVARGLDWKIRCFSHNLAESKRRTGKIDEN